MPFFIKRCLNFLQFEWLFTLHTALAWIKFHTPVIFPFFQAVQIILYLQAITLRFYCKVNDSVIGKKTDPLKEFFKAFWLSKINHSSERLKVVYKMHFLFYAIINCQFETSELNNVEKLVKQTVKF